MVLVTLQFTMQTHVYDVLVADVSLCDLTQSWNDLLRVSTSVHRWAVVVEGGGLAYLCTPVFP